MTDDRNRLRWQCRRGLLELDILLNRFLDNHYTQLPAQQQVEFTNLLTQSDQTLLAWLTGQAEVPTPFKDLVDRILLQ